MRRPACITLTLLVTGCGATAGSSGPKGPQRAEDLGQGHPLRGRIWDCRAAAFIDEATLGERLARHRFVLLGEKHDNPEHHRIQARMLGALVQKGRRPAVAWEMITVDEQQALQRFVATGKPDAAALGPAVDWEQRGWPPWRIYQPIARVALDAGLPLVAAGIGRERLMAAVHSGHAAASQPEGVSLPEAAEQDLAREVRAAHCGHSSPRMEQMMVQAQQLRDGQLARSMRGHADGAVLIAGNGHVRRDRGVPFHLRAMGEEPGSAAALGVLEVQHDQHEPAPYAAGVPGMGPAFDYIWFTLRVDNIDPCEKFREQLKRMKSGGAGGGSEKK